MKNLYLFSLMALSAATMTAQSAPSDIKADTPGEEKPRFEVHPTGRILMDGGVFVSPQKEMFKDGFGIPDVRLGVKMKYGKWNAKVDVGFAYGKVGLKDIYIGYDFSPEHNLKVGSFIHQFGLQSATSSSMKPTMEEPISNAVFNDSRQLGIQYEYNGAKFLASASVHLEPAATTVILSPEQFTHEAFGMRNGNPDTHDAFTFKSDFPTRITRVTAIDATVDKAKNLFKFTPEILASYGRFALESQYFMVNINRCDGRPAFVGQGAYVTLRGLILGRNYTYDSMGGGIATPAPKNLELVLDYNYTTLTDRSAGIYGGRLNDFSATLNYYINKYMIARLHYSYTHTWDGPAATPISLNCIMARLQVIF